MQKQNKTINQARQNNNSLAIKQSQGSLISPQGLQIISWAISLSCFAETKTPRRQKKLTVCCPPACRPPDQLEPEGWWCWLLKYNLVTSPPTNGHKNCAWADHTPCHPLPHAVFKNPSLKAIPEFGSFEHELPVLAWSRFGRLAINAVLSFITTWCQ